MVSYLTRNACYDCSYFNFYFYSKQTSYSSEDKTYYTTSLTGYFPAGRQVEVQRSYPGTLTSGIDTDGTKSASYALGSWTVNTYTAEVGSTPLIDKTTGRPYTEAALTSSELKIITDSIKDNASYNISTTEELAALSENNLYSTRANTAYVKNATTIISSLTQNGSYTHLSK